MNKDELKTILEKFAGCGWDLISVPSEKYLKGSCSKDELIKAVEQADAECGSCGCEMDEMYKTVLSNVEFL